MRRDFDYVTMDDYALDMKETADHASGAMQALMRQNANFRQLIARLVLAVGGEIKLPDECLREPADSLTLEQWVVGSFEYGGRAS